VTAASASYLHTPHANQPAGKLVGIIRYRTTRYHTHHHHQMQLQVRSVNEQIIDNPKQFRHFIVQLLLVLLSPFSALHDASSRVTSID
jgi:hypothetical protein